MNATSVPGIPDVGGRPLWKLEKLGNKVGWKSTFMFQQPIADPPGAKKILWYRIYWEQIGGELVIVRVDKLTVDGDANSTPQSVLLIDDYRSVCGKPVPFRVRFFGLGNTFVYGAELLVSDLKVNDYVDVPVQMKIPTGSRVRNQITGTKSRQPASQNSDPTTDAELIQGTWNVVEMQQIGYEPSEGEKEFYKNGGYKITFTKNKMIASVDHSSMKYRVDATESPGVLELLKDGQVIAKAIYELDGDELRICQGRTPTDGTDPKAPPSFDIKQAASEFPTLMVLRRTKAIEPVAYMHSVHTNARPPQQASAELLIEARKALQVYQDSLGWKQKLDMRVTNLQVHADVGKVTTDTRIRRDAPRMVTSSVQTFDDQPKDHIRLDNWASAQGVSSSQCLRVSADCRRFFLKVFRLVQETGLTWNLLVATTCKTTRESS